MVQSMSADPHIDAVLICAKDEDHLAKSSAVLQVWRYLDEKNRHDPSDQ